MQGLRPILAACLLGLVGCQPAPTHDTLYQVSLIDALLAGQYDGFMTIDQLRARGDFGIGTFDKLHGEMVVLDGTVYQVTVDGSINVMPGDATTPFAAVAHFKPDQAVRYLQPLPLAEFEAKLDAHLQNTNVFYAVRVDTMLNAVTLRTVPAQLEPYAPLAEVVKQQVVWEHTNVQGTLVGLRCPAYTQGVNVPGYHWHFLSDDRAIGGHVLAAELRFAQAYVDTLTRWEVELPSGEGFHAVDLDADRSHELEHIER